MAVDRRRTGQRGRWRQLSVKINRAYRYELKPNVAQRILLAKHAGCARFAYNWGLARRIELYERSYIERLQSVLR